ncbi:MAG TPA: GNAT family N-acetyltransferase [Solirubrobacteraceae bacterium]
MHGVWWDRLASAATVAGSELMTTVRLAQSLTDLKPYLEPWDRLAIATSRPLQRPAWLLGWWQGERAVNDRSELRVALAVDAGRLVGVLPLHVADPEARIPVHEVLSRGAFWGLGPLLASDAPPETVQVIAEALAASSPAPIVLSCEAVDRSGGWPQLMASSWPSRGARLYTRVSAVPSYTVTLQGSFEEWLRRTRRPQDARRRLRRLAERGVELRQSGTASEFRADLASLARLHQARWAQNSQWLSPAVEVALSLAGSEFVGSGGARLWVLDGEEGVIGATLFASAGSESWCLMTAFDEAWREYGPGMATIVEGVSDAFARGEQIVDLGYGDFPYKRLLADSCRPVAWLRLFPRIRGYARARAHWLPVEAREQRQQMRNRLRVRQRLEAVHPHRRQGG